MHDMLFVLRRTIKDEKEPVLIFCASQVESRSINVKHWMLFKNIILTKFRKY